LPAAKGFHPIGEGVPPTAKGFGTLSMRFSRKVSVEVVPAYEWWTKGRKNHLRYALGSLGWQVNMHLFSYRAAYDVKVNGGE
jgi:hypothetical protein